MAKYDPVGTIYRKRPNPWPGLIVGFICILMLLSALN
jgi:hypothetical protein